MGDDEAADQITREVFGYIWENPDAYDPKQGSLRSWIARLTQRQAVHRLRQTEQPRPRDPAEEWRHRVREANTAARADFIVTSMPAPLRAALELAYLERRDYRRRRPAWGSARTRRGAGCGSACSCCPPPWTRDRQPEPSARPARGSRTGDRPAIAAAPAYGARGRATARATATSTRGPPHAAVPARRRQPAAAGRGRAAGAASACPSPRPPPRRGPVRPASASDRLPRLDHATLKSLLGAWALAACSAEEALGRRGAPHRLRDLRRGGAAAARTRWGCCTRRRRSTSIRCCGPGCWRAASAAARPASPCPSGPAPYDAEAARLDALLRDLGDGYWNAPVRLQWFDGAPVGREFTVAQVIAHLTAVDSLVAGRWGCPRRGGRRRGRPAGPGGPGRPGPDEPRSPSERDGADPWPGRQGCPFRFARRHQAGTAGRTRGPDRGALGGEPAPARCRRALAVARAGPQPGADGLLRGPGRGRARRGLRRVLAAAAATRSWTGPSSAGFTRRTSRRRWTTRTSRPRRGHLHRMIDLAARLLPTALAERRRAGLTTSRPGWWQRWAAGTVAAAGDRGRRRRDMAAAAGLARRTGSEEDMVAHVAMDSVSSANWRRGTFEPERTAVGQRGDGAVIRDVLFATASLSRL